MSVDNFPGAGLNSTDAARKGYAITPSDSADLPIVPRAIFVGGAGNITLRLVDDSANIVLNGCLAGSIIPVRANKVMSTGTTATNLVALY